jgi:nucleoside-diphosphate-sugar epimerase
MVMNLRLLITGGAGYVGSVLTPTCLEDGYRVTVVDNLMYGQSTSLAACCANPRFEFLRGDVRDISFITPLLKDNDVIIPLAALVGAPLCSRRHNDAVTTNQHAVQWLATAASKDQLILYPNSNSGYGKMPPGSNAPLDEDSPLNPLSVYAQTKQRAEEYVLERSSSVVFRLATVFGASPRMRTDLLLNDFVLRAVRDGFITLFDPNARRNFIHVRDVAAAFLKVIDCWGGAMWRRGVYNLGQDSANMTKLELCEAVKERVPNFQWHVGGGGDPDKRDYVVSNARLHEAGFRPKYTVDDGVVELLKLYRAFPVTPWGNV